MKETLPAKLRVFLCHSSKDKVLVRTFYQRLSDEGFIDPWLDEIKIMPGHNWEQQISKALKETHVFIVCLSKDSISKEGYLQKEIKYALDMILEKPEGSIFIIPLKLQRCDVPDSLGKFQWVDYFGRNKEKNYQRLIIALKQTAISLNVTMDEEAVDTELTILEPQDMLFEQARIIEAIPPEKRDKHDARLQEIKSVLIRTLISDQPVYVDIASQWFTFSDLLEVKRSKIGTGKIGGKAAGMLLANKIVSEVNINSKEFLKKPLTFYLGSDVMYSFMQSNKLMAWVDQVNKNYSEIQARNNYQGVIKDFESEELPNSVLKQIRRILKITGKTPIIVRSSSLLEDSFTTSFVGKYVSVFCANQGTEKDNLDEVSRAVRRVYASCFSPDALMYHRRRGVMDFIAIIIQVLDGEKFGQFFMPHGSGVAFSRNIYRWAPQIRREDGFVRLVWGFGTRATNQESDYPRLIALSHPMMHPSLKNVEKYSQKNVDLIDLKRNTFITMRCESVLSSKYPPIRLIAQTNEDGYITSIKTNLVDSRKMVITYDEMIRKTDFALTVRSILGDLEKYYRTPVDIEFSVTLPQEGENKIKISLLQCRPQTYFEEKENTLPEIIKSNDIVFSTQRMIPRGAVKDIRYVLFVHPQEYFSLQANERIRLERTISKINTMLGDSSFICVGPGRWGTSSPDLGIHVSYNDVFNSKALIELSGQGMGIGTALEPSFGTHFFQDLIESRIYLLPIYLDDDNVMFNSKFFFDTKNSLSDFIDVDLKITRSLRLIRVADFKIGHHITLIMNDNESRAVAFFERD